jgi:hypothetical protein
MDIIGLEILEDGTITVRTSEISSGNHMSADDLMRQIDEMMGGRMAIAPNEDAKRKAHAHVHKHNHAHTH